MNVESEEPEQSEQDDSTEEEVPNRVNRILPIKVPLTAVLAQKSVEMDEVLSLRSGVVIELDKNLDEPLYLCVGDEVVAEGETVKIEDKFGLQINNIVSRERKQEILERLSKEESS